ncbi:MAG: 4Fe-4S dicluster domain-containing protein [Armatimonadota bacterium]
MNWTEEAQQAIDRAPFFVRSIARRKTEEYVRSLGRDTVTVEDVTAAKGAVGRGDAGAADEQDSSGDAGLDTRAIEQLVADLGVQGEQAGRETAGYVLRVCAGAVGCPRALVDLAALRDKVLEVLEGAELEPALRERHPGPLLRHHKFRVSLAACTNACSEPQTKDFGVIGQALPRTTDEPCDLCRRCVLACGDEAIELGASGPSIDTDVCTRCGDCVRACPTAHLAHGRTGYRIMLGGRLGRRPRLATPVADLASEEEVLETLRAALRVFVEQQQPKERFAEALDRVGLTAVQPAAGETDR